MSNLHDMKLQKQRGDYQRKYGKPAGDIDFTKNPLDEFELMMRKKLK